MANRLLSNRVYSGSRDRKFIDAKVSFGGTGAPTLSAANSMGVISCTRDAQGKFTFVFGVSANGVNRLDSYVKLLGARVTFDTAGVGTGAAAAAPKIQVIDNQIADNTKAYVQVMLTNPAGTTATDPASGEIGYFAFEFGDSNA